MRRVCAPRLCAALFLSFLFAPHLARAEQKTIAIPCPPDAIELPEGGLRAASDGNAWGFVLAPEAHVTIWNQQWTFNGQNLNSPNLNPGWGTFGGGNGSNSFSWIPPTQGGSYSITVKAKRKCAGEGGGLGGGPPIDENFEVSWNVDVEEKRTWTTPTPISATWTAPAPNAIVAPSTPVGCSVAATDSDHWTKGVAPDLQAGDDPDTLIYNWSASGGGYFRGSGASVQFIPPNATGSYTISCQIDDEPTPPGSLDTGTRDDAPVTLTRTVVVPPRDWTADTMIAAPLDAKGAPAKDKDNLVIQNGRMIAPQNQIKNPPDPANPKIVKVRPGADLSCLLEAAGDWDKWTRAGLDITDPANLNLTFGHAEDKAEYSWSATGGAWKNNATGNLTATWIAPALVEGGGAGDNIYTLTCVVDDEPAAVNAPDTGLRDDAVITRTVRVQVVDDTSWMSLKLHRKGVGNEPGEAIAGPCGGDVVIAVEIQVGGQSKLVVPPSGAGIGSGMKIRVEEHDGLGLHDESENHAYFDVPLGTAGAWQKWENNAWQNTNELPTAENDGATPVRYRALLDWKTTEAKTSADPDGADANTLQAGKLWGHNSSHSIALEYSAKVGNDWQIKHEAEFQSKEAGGNYEAARKAGPNGIGADVRNLVITEAKASDGNLDYIRFDPDSDNPQINNPSISFQFNDADFVTGDSYNWYIQLTETNISNLDSLAIFGTLYQCPTNPVPIELPVDLPRGVYGFDVGIEKIRGNNIIDDQSLRSKFFTFSDTGLDFEEDNYLFSYRIKRSNETPANVNSIDELKIQALNPAYTYGEVESGPNSSLTDDIPAHVVPAPSAFPDLAGEGRVVVTGKDLLAQIHRDHLNKRIQPLNATNLTYTVYVLNGPDI